MDISKNYLIKAEYLFGKPNLHLLRCADVHYESEVCKVCIEDVGAFLKVVSGAEEEGSIVNIEELREVEWASLCGGGL